MKNKIVKIFFALLILVSLCLIIYPNIKAYYFYQKTNSVVEVQEKVGNKLDDEKKEHLLEEAREYNKNISMGTYVSLGNVDFKEDKYNHILNVNNDGVMAVVSIPSIDVTLPVFHGTDESILEKGVGHIKESSLPIGEIGTHSMLTAHTGFPKAKLFTDLDKVKKGDYFYITVLNNKLAYKVKDIKVVLPEEIENLAIENDKDLCTLITCTPYGINSHRLLVTGERTKVPQSKESKEEKIKLNNRYMVIIAILVILIAALVLYLTNVFNKRKEENYDKKK